MACRWIRSRSWWWTWPEWRSGKWISSILGQLWYWFGWWMWCTYGASIPRYQHCLQHLVEMHKRNIVAVPQNGNSVFWYSFDYGHIHVIQMSSEHDFAPGSVQYKWIEEDLASINRKETPWVILTAHRMMVRLSAFTWQSFFSHDIRCTSQYTTKKNDLADLTVSRHFRELMEPLLHTYKVNLMMVRRCASDQWYYRHILMFHNP